MLWNPDEDVDALLADFYERFYGPAAKPMGEYWNAIFKAWEETIVTEHEYFIAPAIYTPEVLAVLRKKMAEAQQIAAGLQVQGRALSRNEKQFVERIRVTGMSSLGSISGGIAFPIAYVISVWAKGEAPADHWPFLGFTLLVSVLLLARHRANIGRILRGTEARFSPSDRSNATDPDARR